MKVSVRPLGHDIVTTVPLCEQSPACKHPNFNLGIKITFKHAQKLNPFMRAGPLHSAGTNKHTMYLSESICTFVNGFIK